MAMREEESDFCKKIRAMVKQKPQLSGEEIKKFYEENLPDFFVGYSGGEDNKDFMEVTFPVIEIDSDDGMTYYDEIELIAQYKYDESEFEEDDDGNLQLIDDTASYEPLKAEIIKQAGEHKVPIAHLKFCYD
jgi:hypothetical protein